MIDSSPWALSLFLPSEKDNGSLSVYEVDDETQARTVAAALMMKAKDDQRYAFAVADTGAIIGAKVKVITSQGTTSHAGIDQLHRDLRIPSVAVAMTVASLFLNGDVFAFEKKELWPELSKEAAADQFNHLKLAETGGNFYPGRLARLIKDRSVGARGKAVMDAASL